MKKRPRATARPPRHHKLPRHSADAIVAAFRWRAQYARWEGPWAWELASPRDILADVVRVLHEYEMGSWSDLVNGSRHNHYITVESIVHEAQQDLEKHWPEDLPDRLWSLHIHGKVRIWGIRQGDVFQLVWYDPEHTVFPVAKPRT